jgi:hypothetical protein
VGDITQSNTSASPFGIDQNKPLTLYGHTVANGLVTLTIHSIPKTVTTTADKDGNWSYTVSGLEPGSHTVQASVKDPATGQTSSPSQLLAFTVKAVPKAVANTELALAKKSSKLPLILGVIVLLVLAGIAYYWWNKQKNKAEQSQPPVINPQL